MELFVMCGTTDVLTFKGGFMKPVVTVEIYPIDIDGEPFKVGDRRRVLVNNHWNDSRLIVLTADGASFTISAEDLQSAIQSALSVRSI